MNIALIIAGGTGSRMMQDVPKQFLNVLDKPIIIYTLEAFQSHPNVDSIVVVCVEGWHEIVRAYCRQFGITKLDSIVSGGETGQESIRKGLLDIASSRGEEDVVVMIHEAVRPMVSAEVISDSLRVCSQYGGAVAAIPCNDAMMLTQGGTTSTEQIPRDNLVRAQNPHTYPLKKLLWAHGEAKARGILSSVATSTLMIELGETLHFSAGAEKNFKITAIEDVEIFKALLLAEKPGWLR